MATVKYGAGGKTLKGKSLKAKISSGNFNRWEVRLATTEQGGDTIIGDSKADILSQGNITNKLYVSRKKASKGKPAGGGQTVKLERKTSFSAFRYMNEQLDVLSPKLNNTMDLGTSTNQFKSAYFDGIVFADKVDTEYLKATDGLIDNVTIGATTPKAGTFTSINVDDGNITQVGAIGLDSIYSDTVSDVKITLGQQGIAFNADDGNSYEFNNDEFKNTDLLMYGENENIFVQFDASEERVGIGALGGSPSETLTVVGTLSASGNVDFGGNLDVTGDIDCDDIDCDNFNATSGHIAKITKAQGNIARTFALNTLSQDVSNSNVFLTNSTILTGIRTFTNPEDFQIVTII